MNLSPGGSSGGEATLIASGGSIIGIASDAAGSSRIPAHFTGIVGFKPSAYRLRCVNFRNFFFKDYTYFLPINLILIINFSPSGVHPPLPEIVGGK